jgi:amidase
MVAEIMQKLGHEVIEWKPTITHEEIQKSVFKTWIYDGGKDAREKIGLSGEPFVPQVAFYGQETPQYAASEIFENNVIQRTLQEEYMDYWNSTAALTKDGSVVDCIISPVAPFAAARRERYNYVGYTTWVNLLDYTSVVVPVTTANKKLDPTDLEYSPRNNDDKVAFDSC